MSGAGPAVRRHRPDLIPLLLFAASAAFVLWRNTEVGVLVDIAYVLNTATRIAAGDVPYAQFPLAQAPLEFLVQAGHIKVFGPHYVVQIAYATVLGGLATFITYGLVRRMLEGAVPQPRMVTAVLTAPLVPLGIYAIHPHPFYDNDSCLLVLVALAAIVGARERPSSTRWLLAGSVVAIPIFMKQNIGGAFIVAIVGALGAEAVWRRDARPGLRWFLAGLVAALGVELIVLQLVVGIDSYIRWAWTFALAGRGVTVDRIRQFADPWLLIPAALVVVLVLAAQRLGPRGRAVLVTACFGAFAVWVALATALVAAPFLFPAIIVAARSSQ